MTINRLLFFLISVIILETACNKDKEEIDPGKSTAVFNPSLVYGTIKDQDSISYQTIKIGNQTWMAENLRTTKLNDGIVISNIKEANTWKDITSAATCTYKNISDPDSVATFGRLYNWYAIQTGKLAPKGWHVATREDWDILVNYLGKMNEVGGKLIESGVTHWAAPNTFGNNETGFTALPGGYRDYGTGSFMNLAKDAVYWTNYSNSAEDAYRIYISSNDKAVYSSYAKKNFGFSVRCIKD